MPWPTNWRITPNPALAATASTAAEMSSMWLPGTAAAIPAYIASRVRSISWRTSGGGSPT